MAPASEPLDPEFEALIRYIQESRAGDFRGYKKTSLRRRVLKRMEEVNAEGFSAYHAFLEAHPQEVTELLNTVLINVTSFFRDAEAWDALRQEVLPRHTVTEATAYATAAELRADLDILHRSLSVNGSALLAQGRLRALRRAVQVFGFHLASVDLRQNSDVHERVLIELFRTGSGADYASMPEQSRTALLLAHHHGASMIITVGLSASMTEFLDRGRSGSNASTFLTRLQTGATVVDGRMVAALHRNRMSGWGAVLLLVAAAAAVTGALLVSRVSITRLRWIGKNALPAASLDGVAPGVTSVSPSTPGCKSVKVTSIPAAFETWFVVSRPPNARRRSEFGAVFHAPTACFTWLSTDPSESFGP